MYRVGGKVPEEIADESAECSGEETEKLASEEEVKTTGGGEGGAGRTLASTAGE